MIRTFFVLDFDKTYDNETDMGVTPLVYLIPLDKVEEVKGIALKASTCFNEPAQGEEFDECIGDYFEQFLDEAGIAYVQVGSLDIPFEERQEEYLADYIPTQVV